MKLQVKLILSIFATIICSPLIIATLILPKKFAEHFFKGSTQLLSLVPWIPGVYFRAAYLHHVCNAVNREVTVGFLTLFSQRDIDLGKNICFGPQCNVGSCAVGKDTLVGSGTHILSGYRQHGIGDKDKPFREQEGFYEKIKIGENVWIGNNATIMADIGDHSLVAAGSVVVKPVPPNTVVAGNPARVIRSR